MNNNYKPVIYLNEKEQKLYDEFANEHYSKHKFRGGVPVTLTPTGLGGCDIEVMCPRCKETKNISDIESW
jgi:hypothetical protein